MRKKREFPRCIRCDKTNDGRFDSCKACTIKECRDTIKMYVSGLKRAEEMLNIAWEAMQGTGHVCPETYHKNGLHWGGCLQEACRKITNLGFKPR